MSNNCHLLKEKPLVFKWLSSCSPCSLECKDRAGRRCPYIDWVLSPALACLAPRSRCKDQTGRGPYREAPPIKGLNYCDQGGSLHRYISYHTTTSSTRSPPGMLNLSLVDFWAKRLNTTTTDATKCSNTQGAQLLWPGEGCCTDISAGQLSHY